jgi:hypothetical protein
MHRLHEEKGNKLTELNRLRYSDCDWKIEECNRGLNQYYNIDRCQHRSRVTQITHIGLAISAFLRLERFSYKTVIFWMNEN